MYRSQILVAGLAATALVSALACSSADTPAGPEIIPGRPPAAGGVKAPKDADANVTYAISKLFLGGTNRDGTSNKSTGWKQYGFNLDSKVSTEGSKDVCKPRPGAVPKNVLPDGNNGIDNSFGHNVLPLILAAASDAETSINDSIKEGSFTIMIDVEHLGADKDYNPLTARLYGGASLGAPAKFDGTDVWPLIPELLNDPTDPKSSKVKFDKSYLVENTWVSGSQAPINLALSVSGFTVNLTIGSAIVAFKLSPDHKTATEGTIAGVLETDVLTEELKKVVAGFDSTFCDDNATVDSILTQIRQASDIMKDGSQNPAVECDGISIGLGFNLAQVKLGPVGTPAEQKDPCAGAGGAGGGTGTGGAGTGGSGTGGAGGN